MIVPHYHIPLCNNTFITTCVGCVTAIRSGDGETGEPLMVSSSLCACLRDNTEGTMEEKVKSNM